MSSVKKLASILAAVLMTAQVISVVPVYAEEAVQESKSQTENEQTNSCSHVNCKNNVSKSNGSYCNLCSEEGSYTSNDNENTHTYIINCKKCGEIARSTEQCVTADGICTKCGQTIQKEKCCHRECKNYSEGYNTYCSSCRFNVTGYQSNNDGYTHTETYDCPGCSNKGTQVADCYFADGKCTDCGQAQKYTTCIHPGCERPVAPGSSRCEVCSQSSEVTTYWKSAGEKVHHVYTYYSCCQSTYQGYDELHSFNAEGKCKCGYAKGENSVVSDDRQTGSDSNAKTEENVQYTDTPAQQAAEIVTTTGKKVVSSVSSVIAVTAINGAAVTTPKQSINEIVGITGNDANASFFVCNNKNSKKMEQMSEQAKKIGKTLYNMFNSDLYTITKKGIIEKIHETEKPVTLMFGLPSALQNKKVSIIAYNNKTGEYIEFEDTDNDPKTITIDATIFGVYALVVTE